MTSAEVRQAANALRLLIDHDRADRFIQEARERYCEERQRIEASKHLTAADYNTRINA